MEKVIKVGVGVLLINSEGKILYGFRTSNHGGGTYSPPGGHLEYGETIEECSKRELYEEAGISVDEKDISIYCTLNEIYPNNEKHYINIITLVSCFSGEVENKEPEKMQEWLWLNWHEIKNLGEKNFLPMQNFIKTYPKFDPKTFLSGENSKQENKN